MSRKLRISVIASILVAVVASAVAVAAVRPTPAQKRAHMSVSSGLSSFSVMQRSRLQTDDVPPGITDKIRNDPAIGGAKVRWDAARLATTQQGMSVYVVPAGDGICMLTVNSKTGAGFGCAAPEDVAAGCLASRIVLNGSTVLVGLAPDNVDRVSVHGSTEQTAPVNGNAFVIPAGKGAGSLTRSGPSGSTSEPLPPDPFGIG